MFRLLLLLVFLGAVWSEESLLVTLENGKIEGTYKTSYNGRKYASFEGIPFAARPINNNRFKEPQPVENWNGTLKATQTYTCIQWVGNLAIGTEDCLYINVYVPREKINPEEKLDVIVHIHGGAFMVGSGHSLAGPSKIMDRDVVYVNFNYRLGPLGFMATEDDTFHGNYGMKDQIFALKWVQRNIEKFGGNKDSVTLIGLSAGGASVHLHYFTYNTEVLFHRGWAQSGTAFNPWSVKIDAWSAAKKLIESLGCTDESIKVTLRCMRQRPALQVVEALKNIYVEPLLPLAPFAPVIELLSQYNQEAFLIAHPYIQIKSGHVWNRPLVISQTTGEGSIPSALFMNRIDKLNEKWDEYAPLLLEYYYADKEKQVEVSRKIKEFYLKNESVSTENFQQFVKVCTQRLFHMGAEKSAKRQANVSSENVYFMMFGYRGNEEAINTAMKSFSGSSFEYGVPHGMDGRFLYDISFGLVDGQEKLTPEEEKMKDMMLDMLISFAKDGVPKINGVEWEPVPKEGNLKFLMVNNPEDMQMKTTKKLGAFEFWKSLELREEDNVYKITDSTIEIQ